MKRAFMLLFLCFLTKIIWAQEGTKPESNSDDIAVKLINPTAAIGSLNTFIDFRTYGKNLPVANNQTSSSLTFQPSLPMSLGNGGVNLLIIPVIPIIFSQPIYNCMDLKA